MFKRVLVGMALLPLAATLAGPPWMARACGADSDEPQEFRFAKGNLQQKLRSKKTGDRIDALRQLQDFPVIDAAKLALQVAGKDASPEVREAAYATIGVISDNAQVSKFLLDALDRQMRRKQVGEASVPLLAALLSSKSERAEHDATALLDKMVETTHGARLMAVEMTDQLAARGNDDDVALLVKLSKTKAFANQFGFRRSVIWALTRIDSLPAIGGLIGLLADVDGEAQADAIKYLTAVSNQAFGNNQPAWAKWWEENREHFSIPPAAARTLAAAEKVSPGVTTYYGLPVYARRIVFIMDTSRSMQGMRLQLAKRELVKVIERLQPRDQFAVLVFDNDVRLWQKKLVAADDAAKKKAAQFVNNQDTHPLTASYDALEAALQFDAEAIFFLTDGAPFGGKVTAPAQIVELITQLNRYRRESIYSIGIGAGLPGSPMDVFLRTLAESNFGSYRRVDE
jgi:hypothetical protein